MMMCPCTYGQEVTVSASAGPRVVDGVYRSHAAADVRYLYSMGLVLVLGVTGRLEFSEPTLIERYGPGQPATYTDGAASVVWLTVDAGWRFPLGPLALSAGIRAGGANIAHRRMYERGWFAQDEEKTYANPGFTGGVWTEVEYMPIRSVGLVLGAGYDLLELRRRIDYSTRTGTAFDAVFARSAPAASVGVRYHIGQVGDVAEADTTTWRWFFTSTFASLHPFSKEHYNQFNPGVGVHVRFVPHGSTWFAEAGAYQYSMADRAMYAGAGYLWALRGKWLKIGALGGLLTLSDARGTTFLPALSPRIMIDTPIGSGTVLVIPVGSETAIGFQVALPLN